MSISSIENELHQHYSEPDQLPLIIDGLKRTGKFQPSEATIDDLAPVDEFHVGGREASRHLFDQLEFGAQDHILDIGCGLAGSARFVAANFGCQVTGFDLSNDFGKTSCALCEWTNLQHKVDLRTSSAMSMPTSDNAFDGSYMLHVGMNIPNKNMLFKEIARVLKPGATFVIYDLMRVGIGDIPFPVPWFTQTSTSFVDSIDDYQGALSEAAFNIVTINDTSDFA